MEVSNDPHRVIYLTEHRRYTTKVFPNKESAQSFADTIETSQKETDFEKPIVQAATEAVPEFTKFKQGKAPACKVDRSVLCACGKNKHSVGNSSCFSCSGVREMRRD